MLYGRGAQPPGAEVFWTQLDAAAAPAVMRVVISCRVRQARDAFLALLEENVDRGLVRLSHAKELLGDDPRWRVRCTHHVSITVHDKPAPHARGRGWLVHEDTKPLPVLGPNVMLIFAICPVPSPSVAKHATCGLAHFPARSAAGMVSARNVNTIE